MPKQAQNLTDFKKYISPSKLRELELESDMAIAGYLISLELIRLELKSNGVPSVENYIHPSMTKIKDATGIKSKPTIISSIERLEHKGFFSKIQRSTERHKANQYWVNAEWIATTEEIESHNVMTPAEPDSKIDLLIGLVKQLHEEIQVLKQDIHNLQTQKFTNKTDMPKIPVETASALPMNESENMKESTRKPSTSKVTSIKKNIQIPDHDPCASPCNNPQFAGRTLGDLNFHELGKERQYCMEHKLHILDLMTVIEMRRDNISIIQPTHKQTDATATKIDLLLLKEPSTLTNNELLDVTSHLAERGSLTREVINEILYRENNYLASDKQSDWRKLFTENIIESIKNLSYQMT